MGVADRVEVVVRVGVWVGVGVCVGVGLGIGIGLARTEYSSLALGLEGSAALFTPNPLLGKGCFYL